MRHTRHAPMPSACANCWASWNDTCRSSRSPCPWLDDVGCLRTLSKGKSERERNWEWMDWLAMAAMVTKKVAERQPKMPPNSRRRPCFQSEASCVSRFHRPHWKTPWLCERNSGLKGQRPRRWPVSCENNAVTKPCDSPGPLYSSGPKDTLAAYCAVEKWYSKEVRKIDVFIIKLIPMSCSHPQHPNAKECPGFNLHSRAALSQALRLLSNAHAWKIDQ